jgi:hypothetical protein
LQWNTKAVRKGTRSDGGDDGNLEREAWEVVPLKKEIKILLRWWDDTGPISDLRCSMIPNRERRQAVQK